VNFRFFSALACGALCGVWPSRVAEAASESMPVGFRTERGGIVSIHVYRADGSLVRRLVESKKLSAGAHEIPWDGRADDGSRVAPGEYAWRGLFHEGIGLKLRGWVGSGSAAPWPTADGKGHWGGDAGVPSAVAADAERIYLGWSFAEQGKAILACDLEGRVQWSHRRGEGPSGCSALAVDDGLLYVLGGVDDPEAVGGVVYRLKAKDGKPVPWPNGQLDLKIASFWPADAKTKPEKADAMAVRHDRIYLSFTSSEFLTVLDAKTGAYLQTVVGAPPGQIDVAPTKTDLPDAPGKLVDADFAVISLRGGVLGNVLFAHDPLWVITSELSPIERDVRVNALTVIGDGAKFHRHTAFVGLDAPFHQVQARPLLDMEGFTWVAGKPGGRPLLGPWQADALRAVRGVALDAAGKLWVAEGDAFPKRFSVWETTGQQGRLVREFFGPGSGASAINPLAPDLMIAQNCEWRLDPQNGSARCLGVVAREPMGTARFGVGENGHAYLVTSPKYGVANIFERRGDGDYKLRARLFGADRDGTPLTGDAPGAAVQTMVWADANDDAEMQPAEVQRLAQVLTSPILTAQDLTLHGYEWKLRVRGWTACDAPLYELTQNTELVLQGVESADGTLVARPHEPVPSSGERFLECREVATGRLLWKQPLFRLFALGSAVRGPEPVGNLWPIWDGELGGFQLINESGFVLAPALRTAAAAWPPTATPGMSIPHLPPHAVAKSIAQAIDGKLYLTAGETADWNVEITGLDKVRALAGGKIAVPAAK